MKSLDGSADTPLVSVIVPTYNRPDTLLESLRSIQNQTYPCIEIVVVNDGGMEIEDVLSRSGPEKNIIYIKHGANRGQAAARNSGIESARGKYIAYLDDDDLYYPEHIEILVSFLKSNDYCIAYTDAYRAHQGFRKGKYVVRKRDVPYSFDFDPDRFLTDNYIPVLCIMHEKSCVDRAGRFDEELTSLEDWDLWIRMSRLYKFGHIKKITCEFSWRHDATSMTSARRVDFLRNTKLMYERYKNLASNRSDLLTMQKKIIKRQELVVEAWMAVDRCSHMFGNRLMFLQVLKKYLM